MPVVLIIFGAIFITLAMRGTEHEFAAELGEDFADTHFWAWAAVGILVGAAGYYPPAKRASDLLLVLVILSLTLSQKGVLPDLASLFANPPAPDPSIPLPEFSIFSSSSSSSSSSSGGLGGLGGLTGGSGGSGGGSTIGALLGGASSIGTGAGGGSTTSGFGSDLGGAGDDGTI